MTVSSSSLGMRIGLKFPSSSSSSSSGWQTSTPGLLPDSAAPIPGLPPPFSRLQEPALFRLLQVEPPLDPVPASPSRWCFEVRISLCLCEESGTLLWCSETTVYNVLCMKYLTDEHASRHGEPSAGGEVGGDHDAQASLREGKLVRVEDEEFIYHDDWSRLLTVCLACQRLAQHTHLNLCKH